MATKKHSKPAARKQDKTERHGKAPSDTRRVLTKKDAALRRKGMAAGIQMFLTIERFADSFTDRSFDRDHAAVQSELRRYMAVFNAQPPEAQAGFLFVLADHLFGAFSELGRIYAIAHDRGYYHANPPYSPTEINEAKDVRRGKSLSPVERKALAQQWLQGGAA